MWMPDVNVLVYAHRGDESTNPFYKEWMERLVDSPEPFALSVLVAVGFIRIVTNPRMYAEPTPVPLALGIIDTLVSRRSCRLIPPGPRHWPLTRDLCAGASASGKLVADAQHAALAIEHGCTWATRDRDFERFVPFGLRWHHLAATPPPR